MIAGHGRFSEWHFNRIGCLSLGGGTGIGRNPMGLEQERPPWHASIRQCGRVTELRFFGRWFLHLDRIHFGIVVPFFGIL